MVAELQKYIGKVCLVPFKLDCKFAATIVDVRQVWNRVDVLVRPFEGIGKIWVALDSVSVDATGFAAIARRIVEATNSR